MALINVTAEYVAGGYPAPTYRGTVSFGMNVDDASSDGFEDEVRVRARERAARDGCWSLVDIRIGEIAIERE